MSRPPLFLTVTVKAGKMPFGLCWPIPIFVLTMFLDVMVDLTDLASCFVRHAHADGEEKQKGRKAVLAVNAGARSLYMLLQEKLSDAGPWELVSVEVEGFLLRLRVI